MIQKLLKHLGFSLVELVVAIAVFMIIVGSMAVLAAGNHLTVLENNKRFQANVLLSESWEALHAIRNQNWANISNGTHGLRFSNRYWEFYGSSDTWDGITRQITVSDLSRDPSGAIVESGGTVDPDSKRIQIQFSWEPSEGQNQSFTVDSYLNNYSNAAVWPPET